MRWKITLKFRHLDTTRPLLEASLSKVSGTRARLEKDLAPKLAAAATSETLLLLPR